MARKTYTEEEVHKRIEALPEAVGDYLYSAQMAEEVRQISDKNHLHIDQMSLLEAETGELILGLTDTQEFVPNLISTLGIEKGRAEAIARDVSSQIVSKIRKSMGAPGTPQPASATPAPSKTIPTPISPTSVVMPSSPAPKPPAPAPTYIKPVAPPAPMPVSTPQVAKPAPVPPAPKPAANFAAADAMLGGTKVSAPAAPAQKPATTVSLPAAPAPVQAPKPASEKPQNYKADPYREPIE